MASSISGVSLLKEFYLNCSIYNILSKIRDRCMRRKNKVVVSIVSHIKRIKLSNLESKVLITENLECDYSLIISKN